MLNIVIYTKPSCVQCEQTQKLIAKELVAEVTLIDLTQDAEAHKYVTEGMGYASAPVVMWDCDDQIGGHWAGFKPDKIRELKTFNEPRDQTPMTNPYVMSNSA